MVTIYLFQDHQFVSKTILTVTLVLLTLTDGSGTMDEPHMQSQLITQEELSDLIRDLYLSKQQSALLY